MSVPSLDDPFLNTEDVAKMFGVDVPAVRYWIRTGKLNAVKFNGYWKVLSSEAKRLAEEMYGE